jgi:hypothetical protein
MEFPKFTTALTWQRRALLAAVGALGGYAYYSFIGCASGACPISSNPWISTGYGALIGALLVSGKKNVSAPNESAAQPEKRP